ncbi:hypothetical protein NLU03_29375 [Bacillus toyonensis]|nr:hypothetical protein [Bacillus toyonensis]
MQQNQLFTLSDVEIPRIADVLTQHKEGEYFSISVKIKNGDQLLQNWNDGTLSISDNETPSYAQIFQMTPIKKGSNKICIKGTWKFISTATGAEEGYGVSPNRVWTLEDCGLFGTFRLKNEKGQYLSVDGSSVKITDDHTKAALFHTDLKESEWINWLNKWYSGK